MPDKVNLNSATVDDLARIPGVGHDKAQSIVDYRESHGKFHSVDELSRVQQLKPAQVDVLRKRTRV